jgi:hypothetical protein
MEKRIERPNGNQSRETYVATSQMTSTSLATSPVTQNMPSPTAAGSGVLPTTRNHVSQRTGSRASSNHQSDLERLRKLKEEILMGYDPHFYAYPRPDALEALSLRHNPAAISSTTTHQITNEPAASRANDASRIHTDQRPRLTSAPQIYDQNSIAAEASAHKQSRQLSPQTADSSRAARQDNQEARPESAIDAERMLPTTSSSNYAVTNGSLNGKRPRTPIVTSLASGRNGLPTPQSVASTNQSTPASTSATAGVKEHGMKSEMSTAIAENAPSSPSPLVKDELNSMPSHKIPPRPNPGGPLGVSIPLSAGSRDTIPLNSSRTAPPLGTRPEPVLLKRSEFEAIEKEKERLVQETSTVDRDEASSRSAKPGQEGDPARSRPIQHDIYIPERSPSPHRTSDTLLATEARPRGVQHDIYVPPTTPPLAGARDSEATRPKGVPHDVYVPPPSPSRERDLRARADPARYDSRLDRGESYRPESERERDRDRGVDMVDARRPEYRSGNRYEDMRDSRARLDDRSYPNANRAVPSAVDAKSSDTRALRLVSPPRSLAERLDVRDVRPAAADTYRSRDLYDSRDLRGSDRESFRDPVYRVAPSPPRRAPSPGRSVRREPEYRSSTTYEPRSYEPPPREWPREDAATYESRRTMWTEEERRREYERDRASLDAARRDDYDRRTAYPATSARPDPRDWPPPSDAPSADYYRTVDPVKPSYPSTSYDSTADRYPPERAPVSRVRPRSPSPAPYRNSSVGYIPPSRPSHPESEVARNAKRARMMEALQQGRQISPSTSQPPHLARQGPDYHPPTRMSSTPAFDDRRDSRRTASQRSSSPMREVEYAPPRPRSPVPVPAPPSYRPAEGYPPRPASPNRYAWDREGARYASQRI